MPPGSELVLILGGPQGAGLETSAQVLATSFAHIGYGIISDREYFSNIKGRHSYIHARVSSRELPRSLTYPAQILGAMDPETVFTHYKDVDYGGYLIYDVATASRNFNTIPSIERELKNRLSREFRDSGLDGTVASVVKYLREVRKVNVIDLNYQSILAELRRKFGLTPAQASRYLSGILVGAVSALMNLDEDSIAYGLVRRFGRRQHIIEHNKYLISRVSEMVKERFGSPLDLGPSELEYDELLVASGNDVVAMAKIVGGLGYQSYYPITPAQDECFTLESYENIETGDGDGRGVVVLQTEDEIAAITSAIGAALTGARSSTATSGPGFSLMVEGLGWAGMNEVPVVVTFYQRGGPSTGLPTRGSQSELLYTLFASHGEFGRIVITSGDHEEAFYDAIEAFNLAEKYQMPVIHLLDKFIANSMMSIGVPDMSSVKIERGRIVNEWRDYNRFDLSSGLISPRPLIGRGALIYNTGDEHDERGAITEDPVNRAKMYAKRIKKLEIADKEIPQETRAVYYGPDRPDFMLVGWGFVKGAALHAIDLLNDEGLRGAYLHIKMFSPFPSDYVKKLIEGVGLDNVISVEHNYLAQSGKVISMNTGLVIKRSITKYTGRPIYTHELLEAVKLIVKKGEKRVVLTYGA